ncbi:MAG: hypothetical protein WBG53_07360 [Rhodococcus sp. (in: high G+C Gram-positive bacteria)]|uniref:hypothetical protein n=1 Tax=Rhodococcus sp. SBT000017 TaxID=1803385 RepID=UPI000EF935F5|nr:hypothetical protein [Rhodococcus sp. SBT000017]RMB76309.1 hypothetical protein AYK61_06935 [Rhodococcus sp. SBT000017]
MSTSPENLTPPATFRSAGALVAAQGLASLVAAIVLLVRAFSGEGDNAVANGYGTAGWFGVLGIGVGAAGVALILGKRWGRSIATVVQLLLLPVVWSLLTGSHQTVYGVALGAVVVGVLVLLFSPPSSRWMAAEYSDVDDELR